MWVLTKKSNLQTSAHTTAGAESLGENRTPKCYQTLSDTEGLAPGLPLVWPEQLCRLFPFLPASSAHLHSQTQTTHRHCCVWGVPGKKEQEEDCHSHFPSRSFRKLRTHHPKKKKKNYGKSSYLWHNKQNYNLKKWQIQWASLSIMRLGKNEKHNGKAYCPLPSVAG